MWTKIKERGIFFFGVPLTMKIAFPRSDQLGVRGGLDPFLNAAIPHITFSKSKGFGSLSLKNKKLLSVKFEFIMIKYSINYKWPLRPRRIRFDFRKAIFMDSGTPPPKKRKLFPAPFF